MFYVGQKVCLIKNHGHKKSLTKEQIALHGINMPKHDTIYTVESTDHWDGEETIRLVECCNKHVKTTTGQEFSFFARCFRPLTDISIFTEMLNKKPVEALEEA